MIIERIVKGDNPLLMYYSSIFNLKMSLGVQLRQSQIFWMLSNEIDDVLLLHSLQRLW
jgi:hypothetical protein